MTLYHCWTSPFGPMLATLEENQLTGCYLVGQKYQPAIDDQWQPAPEHALFQQLATQLERYAQQPDFVFTLPLAPKGSAFQQRVWQALQRIPAGTTYYYQQLADALGKPAAVRAVAAAIGKNPLLILIPCHRVVGKNGKLTGFAAGLALKQLLLTHEAQCDGSANKRCAL